MPIYDSWDPFKIVLKQEESKLFPLSIYNICAARNVVTRSSYNWHIIRKSVFLTFSSSKIRLSHEYVSADVLVLIQNTNTSLPTAIRNMIMMTSSNGFFPRYWPLVRGIHRSPVNSLHKGQWRGAMFSFIYAWIGQLRLSKQSWGWWFATLLR